MADTKISALTAATTPLAGTEVLPIVQSGVTKKVSIDNLTAGKAVSALSVTATNLKTSPATANLDISGSTIAATGTDTNININVTAKGSGVVNLGSVAVTGGTINGTPIGGTTRAAGSFTSLVANANIVAQNDTYIQATNPTGGDGGLKLYNSSNNTGSKVARFFGWDGSETGSISTYVNVTTYTTSSDSRLKENIGIATDGSVVDNLIVRDFRWKANGQIDRGVFAQEAVLVKPSAVIEGNDSLTEHGTLAVPWAVDYSKYVPDLVVHAQQLKKLVQSLESRIESLEAEIKTLKGI